MADTAADRVLADEWWFQYSRAGQQHPNDPEKDVLAAFIAGRASGLRAALDVQPVDDERARAEESLRHKAIYGASVSIREEARELLLALEAQTAHDAARAALSSQSPRKYGGE
jgi:hypothetical protein